MLKMERRYLGKKGLGNCKKDIFEPGRDENVQTGKLWKSVWVKEGYVKTTSDSKTSSHSIYNNWQQLREKIVKLIIVIDSIEQNLWPIRSSISQFL